MKQSVFSLALAFGMMISPALAAPYTYEPATCEFKITYPEKPYIEQKCTSGKNCTEVVTYTKVISADTSVNVRTTCSQHPSDELAKYTPQVLQETVKQMTNEAQMSVEEITASEIDGYKTASAVNIGERGDREIFYAAQVWIGKTSLFTIEADMTGPQDQQADQIFTNILKSMQPKSKATAAKKPAKAAP